jgi:hypothetical protein
MALKLRILAVGTLTVGAIVVVSLTAAYLALRQVRPFYQEAIQLDQQALDRGKQELESRATALYTETREAGTWSALFTDEQINGWLANELAAPNANDVGELSESIRAPRIAITPGLLTLGFTTTQGKVETVVSVDASVSLTENGDVAIRLASVQAGSLPLPAAMVADKIATACRDHFPILWTEQDGQPVAVIRLRNEESMHDQRLSIDAIELREGELYVAGHTEVAATSRHATGQAHQVAKPNLDELELHLSPKHDEPALEIAKRPLRRHSARSRGAD